MNAGIQPERYMKGPWIFPLKKYVYVYAFMLEDLKSFQFILFFFFFHLCVCTSLVFFECIVLRGKKKVRLMCLSYYQLLFSS